NRLVLCTIVAALSPFVTHQADADQGRRTGGLQRCEISTRSAVPACSGKALGIVKENVVPFPGVLSTQIRPPWASTMPLVMGSPSPAPSRRGLVACQNRSKTRGTSSGAMPEPVSATQKTTSRSLEVAPATTEPPGPVNLIALPMRFSNT